MTSENNTWLKVAIWIMRIAVAGLFLLSAVTKLMSIDAFELYSFKILPFNWYLTISLVRLLIALEAIIAIGIISGIGYRFAVYFALFFIILSSLWLIQRIWITPNENCYCFGEFINATPLVSLYKNLVTIILLGFLTTSIRNKMHHFDRAIWVLLIFIISFVSINIISPPDYLFKNRYTTEGYLKELDVKQLRGDAFYTINSDNELSSDGIYALISLKCPICKLAAKKISTIQSKRANQLPITMVVLSKNIEGWLPFKNEHQIPDYPIWFVGQNEFLKYTRSLPMIYFIENEKIVKTRSYRDLTDKDFE
jgi:uncharacterized membrane protein YphA (DoxX/SURF4 family)